MIDPASLGLPPLAATYGVGVLGSLAVELGALVRESAVNGGKLPDRYRRLAHPFFRIAFAFVGAGGLSAIMVDQSSPTAMITALYVGIAAPLIFDRVASGIKLNGADPLA
jgi:hypothetical protein